MAMKEGRYYVEYLGWKEARGLYGREFTEPVVRELLIRRRLNNTLPKMTIKLSEHEIHISQEIAQKSLGGPEKTRYPPIPTKDATFVIQSLYPDNDVVACIFLGYNPYTKCAVHVHVYRFDSAATAALFVSHLGDFVDRKDVKERIIGIERDLAELGHVTVRSQLGTGQEARRRSGSDGMSYGTSSPSPHSAESLSPKYPTPEEAIRRRSDIVITKSRKSPTEPDPDMKLVFQSVQEEFEYKLKVNEAPLLLPPKDYDTIVRRHGKLDIRNEVQARSSSIFGPDSIFNNADATDFDRPGPYRSSNNGGTAVNSGRAINGGTAVNGGNHVRSVSAAEQSDSSYTIKKLDPRRMMRSNSDNGFLLSQELGASSQNLRRQSSFASSDLSNNSDEYYADGLYQGYKPKHHKRSKSKEKSTRPVDDASQLAMWSPTYSFGQSGVRNLHTHHEEETDTLNRTAPAGAFTNAMFYQPGSRHGERPGDRGHDIKRSHSHKKDRAKYRVST